MAETPFLRSRWLSSLPSHLFGWNALPKWHKEIAFWTVAGSPASSMEHMIILIRPEYNYWHNFELLKFHSTKKVTACIWNIRKTLGLKKIKCLGKSCHVYGFQGHLCVLVTLKHSLCPIGSSGSLHISWGWIYSVLKTLSFFQGMPNNTVYYFTSSHTCRPNFFSQPTE